MSSIAELKKELELVTEHLRIAKENLEYLKEENEQLKKANSEYFDDRLWFINHPLIDGSEIEVEWYARKTMMSDDEEDEEED